MPFPNTTLLDDFDRTDDASLGADWTEGVQSTTTRAEVVSGTVTAPGAGSSSICAYTAGDSPTGLYIACKTKVADAPSTRNDAIGMGVTKVSDTTQGYSVQLDTFASADVILKLFKHGGVLLDSQTLTGFGQPAIDDRVGLVAEDTGSACILTGWMIRGVSEFAGTPFSASGADYVAGPYYPSLRIKYSDEAIDDFEAALVTAGGVAGGQRLLTLGVG